MPKPKKKTKIVQPILRFYCEGEKTEPQYLNSFKDSLNTDFLERTKWEPTRKNTPVQLVEEAINAKHTEDSNDIYWVVFDRESVNKYSDELHRKARKNAIDNGIFIAFSNVCFELWILLHFEYSTGQYATCGDLIKNSRLKTHLNTLGLNDYEKGINIFDKIQDKIESATNNAIKVRKCSKESAPFGKDKPYQLNPYTDVDELLNSIKIFVKVHEKTEELNKIYIKAISDFTSNENWFDNISELSKNIVDKLSKKSKIEAYHFLYILQFDKKHETNLSLAEVMNKDWDKKSDWNFYIKIIEDSLKILHDSFK